MLVKLVTLLLRIVYSFTEDENYKYLDVRVTAGTWAALDQVVGAENSTTATVNVIEDRLHIIDLTGEFIASVPFRIYKYNRNTYIIH